MKKALVKFYLCLLILSSCESHPEISRTDIYLAQQSTDDNMLFYYRGEEFLSTFKEMMEDKSSPDFAKRIRKLYEFVDHNESATACVLSFIHLLQTDLLKSLGAETGSGEKKSAVLSYDRKDQIRPATFDLSQIQISSSGAVINKSDINELVRLLTQLCETYTEVLASSSTGSDNKPFFFRDPNIQDYSSMEDLNSKILEAIASGNVAMDDQDVIRKVYTDLTKTIHFLSKNPETANWLQSFNLLTHVQSVIYNSRTDILASMRYRFTGCGTGFNKIGSAISGPSVVKRGEKITIEVCMAAYDIDKQPIVQTVNGVLIETKEGKALVEIAGDKPGYKTVKGTITINNKSGASKTLPWEKEIFVTD